jgi:SAM-dependent methyltransferase
MKLFRIRNIDQFKEHRRRNSTNYELINQYESSLLRPGATDFSVKGVSYPANQLVDFKVDYLYSDGVHINWRERLVCPITGLNNRLRCSLHLLDLELNPYADSEIYISEQVTPLFSFLRNRFPRIIGSEFLGPHLAPGALVNDIRHEDMTNLSFEKESIDYYLSFECFEHIPNYKKAIHEIYRVLRPGGMFLGSFPFDPNCYENIIRAKLDKHGNIVHLMQPEYHGDPVNEKGILCFTIFGWQILDEFRKSKFTDAYAILIWSDLFGYLGGEQILFVAKKAARQRRWFTFSS